MDIKAIVKADPSALFMQKISERLYPLTDIPWIGLVTVCKVNGFLLFKGEYKINFRSRA